MTRRTPADIYAAARAAGLSSAQAVLATAIGLGESSGDDTAVGDTNLQNNTWGPSVGIWQIRTLKAQTGTGSDRDISALQGNIARQAQAMWNISNHGQTWTPWTVYNTGAYRKFMTQSEAGATGGGTTPIAASNASLPGVGGIGDTLNKAVKPARDLSVKLMAGALGLALVGVGVYKLAAPSLKKTAGAAAKVGKLAL